MLALASKTEDTQHTGKVGRNQGLIGIAQNALHGT